MACYVDGQLRQSAVTSDLIFDVETVVQLVSSIFPPEAGDVIAMGTPEGVAIGRGHAFLEDGSEVRCEIEGVGALHNTVRFTSLSESSQQPAE